MRTRGCRCEKRRRSTRGFSLVRLVALCRLANALLLRRQEIPCYKVCSFSLLHLLASARLCHVLVADSALSGTTQITAYILCLVACGANLQSCRLLCACSGVRSIRTVCLDAGAACTIRSGGMARKGYSESWRYQRRSVDVAHTHSEFELSFCSMRLVAVKLPE
jgi:hypothetical protein